MPSLLRDEFRKLAASHERPCVSLLMPTRPGAAASEENAAHFRGALRQAQRLLESRGAAVSLLDPAVTLVDDGFFWRRQREGLAAFLCPGEFHLYRTPLPLEELAAVEDHFHLKPLFPLLRAERFFILALSQKEARLLEGTNFSVEPVDVAGLPKGLAHALRFEVFEKQHQTRAAAAAVAGAGSGQFRAQGVENDVTKDRLLRYFRQIDKALHDWLRLEAAPLILAEVEFCLPIYREANTYPHLVADGVRGNPERLDPKELGREAWELAKPTLRRRQDEAAAIFLQERSRRRASSDIAEILPAAVLEGRVNRLFMAMDRSIWGRFDRGTARTELSPERKPDDEDLLDLAALETVLHGGTVHPVQAAEVPGGGPVAALFRY